MIVAAQAAARWARARRAAWTDAPVTDVSAASRPGPTPVARISPAAIAPPPPAVPAPSQVAGPTLSPAATAASPPIVAPAPVVAPTPPTVTATAPPLVLTATKDAGPSAAGRARVRVRFPSVPVAKWLMLAAAGAALIALAVVGGKYLWSTTAKFTTARPMPASTPVRSPLPSASPGGARNATGGLRVSSTPTDAQVRVDGKLRGATPLTLTDLSAGTHTVEIESTAGTVRRSASILAGETTEITESIFPGWLVVYSPFDLSITEGTRPLRLDDRNQVMLAAGPHDLRFVNRALGYEEMRQVEVKPGETTTVSVTPPRSTVAVTATETAQVLVDGTRIGETPLAAVPIDLGTHEIVVRSEAGVERRFTVTVTVQPFTLNVDFSKPG